MQWQFRQEPDGTWRWERWDSNWVLRDSASGFDSASAAERHAAGRGYVPPRRDWKSGP